MKVARIEVFAVDIPFRVKFSHSLKERTSSESIIVRLTLDSGHVGYGEGLPREYVTGETVESAARTIHSLIAPYLYPQNFPDSGMALSCLGGLGEHIAGCSGAAQCAVELAFLDALGKGCGKSVADLFGGPKRDKVFYTGVVSGGSVSSVVKYGMIYKILGFRYIKVKVGGGEDIRKLMILRRILGDRVDIRVDANCAWRLEEARKMIAEMRAIGVKAVEQPLAAGDFDGMALLTRDSGIDIVADESLVTVSDAIRLAESKACSIFNIRISKCGGLFNSFKIKEIANKHGIKCQLGCQVGETSILSSAGRMLALLWPDVKYLEGSYGKYLLRDDIAQNSIHFGLLGTGKKLSGSGWGLDISNAAFSKGWIRPVSCP